MNSQENQSVADNSDAGSAAGRKRPSSFPEVGRFHERLHLAIGDESARSFGRRTGISETVLRKYLSGKTEPTRPALAAMAYASGVCLEWLATGHGAMRITDRVEAVASSQDRRPDPETLKAAVEVLERALETAGATTDAAGRAELLVAVYELLEHGSALDAAERIVASMLRVASGAGRTPAKQG